MRWQQVNAAMFWAGAATIGYTYAGYPLLLEGVRRIRVPGRARVVVAGPEEPPTVTVLIAAWNEARVITEKLENTLGLDYPADRLQVIVAADGSDDGTVEIVRGYRSRGVELSFARERRGKSAAIARALDSARGEIVVFSDANNLYDRDAVRRLVRPFADPSVGASTGAKTIDRGDGALGDSEGLYWRYESWIKQNETALGCCTGVAGEILAVRRSLVTAPPEQVINDDFHLAMQVVRGGRRVVYVPGARSRERVSATAADEVARRTRIVAGRYQAIAMSRSLLPFGRPVVVWQVLSHKYLRPLVPFALAGVAVSTLVAVATTPDPPRSLRRLTRPYSTVALLGQLVFYALAAVGDRPGSGPLARLGYLPRFLVRSNWAAVAGLARYLGGRQPAGWTRVTRRP